jgi:glycosyltransferase involved in cell wall biosynthesis
MTAAIQGPRRSEGATSPLGARETYLLVLPWDLRGETGGVNQVVEALYDGIARDGRLDPKVLVLSWDVSAPVEEHDAAGRSLLRFRLTTFEQQRPLFISIPRYLIRLPMELWRLRRFARDYRVAIVNCHFIGSSDLMWVIAKAIGLFRGKIFLSIHGLDIRTLATLTGFRRRLWRWVLRRADAVVACSEGLASETLEKFGLPLEQVVTIHNGFDTARLGHLLQPQDLQRSPSRVGPSLLNLGTLEHKKGHDILVRAFKNVLERFPTARLTILGRRAETADETQHLVEELGLSAQVSIRSNVPHAVALQELNAANLFVLPSRNEAFSVALLEAGAFGKPIVATNVCGVPELIEDGVTGILVPPESVADLTRGICAMLDDPQTALEYGRRLRERVVTQFSAEQTTFKYLRLAGYVPRDSDGQRDEVARGRVAEGHD